MQTFLWLGLLGAAGACVIGLVVIGIDGHRKLKARRRTEHVRKWVQSEAGPSTSMRARGASAS
jgi:hypothetical protein